MCPTSTTLALYVQSDITNETAVDMDSLGGAVYNIGCEVPTNKSIQNMSA